MAPTRTLTLYNGSDSLPAVDYTVDTDWQDTELPSGASLGEASAGSWLVRDEGGVIPDYILPGRFLNSHNVVICTVGSNTLFRGRVAAQEHFRGRQKAGRAAEWRITLEDQNSHLRGIVVHNWVRGAETDAARAQGLVASYLSGSPRVTTNLNGSNLVITGSNTINLPAKTYSGVTPFEIMQELASNADKEFFVTIDNELAYFGHDYAGYNSTLRISDAGYPGGADANSNTWVPWDPRINEFGRLQLSALRVYYGTAVTQDTIRATYPSVMVTHDYWEDVYWDSESVTAAQATARADKMLAVRQSDQNSFTCAIGPLTGDDIYKIKAGQLISFKARGAYGGRLLNGTYVGDSFMSLRIREIRWTTPAEDQYMAHLTMEKPLALSPNRGSQALTIMPHPPGTGSSTLLASWTFPTTSHYADDTGHGYLLAGTWDGGAGTGGWATSHLYSGYDNPTSSQIPFTAGAQVKVVMDVYWAFNQSTAYCALKFYDAVNTLLETWKFAEGVNYAGAGPYNVATAFHTAPAGTSYFIWDVQPSPGISVEWDNVYMYSGTAADSPPPASTNATGSVGTDSSCYAECDHIHPWQTVIPAIDVAGDLIYGTADNTATRLAIGASNTHLVSDGLIPRWNANTGGSGGAVATDTIWDAAGDLAVGTGADTAVRLAIGASNTHLISDGTTARWQANTFGAVDALSSQASGTGDVTTTTSLADVTGASLSLEAGTYIVTGTFDTLVNNALNDRTFEGHLDSGGVDQNDYANLVAPGLVNVRATIPQVWRLILAATTTVKLRTKHSGGTAGDFTVKSTNTTIAAYRAGGPTAPASARYLRTGGNYTTTSTTYVDVDATNLALTITTAARRALVMLWGAVFVDNVAGGVTFDVMVDGVLQGGSFGLVYLEQHATANEAMNPSFTYLTAPLTAGSHTFKLQWRVTNAAHTATLYGGSGGIVSGFAVMEQG